MGDDSDVQESPKASSYCIIDTPEKEKQKPLTREEDLPSAEETEEKEGENQIRPTIRPVYKTLEEGEGEEKEKQRNEQEEDQRSIKLINEYHSEHESLDEETSQIQNDDDRKIEQEEYTQRVKEQAQANQGKKRRKTSRHRLQEVMKRKKSNRK